MNIFINHIQIHNISNVCVFVRINKYLFSNTDDSHSHDM